VILFKPRYVTNEQIVGCADDTHMRQKDRKDIQYLAVGAILITDEIFGVLGGVSQENQNGF